VFTTAPGRKRTASSAAQAAWFRVARFPVSKRWSRILRQRWSSGRGDHYGFRRWGEMQLDGDDIGMSGDVFGLSSETGGQDLNLIAARRHVGNIAIPSAEEETIPRVGLSLLKQGNLSAGDGGRLRINNLDLEVSSGCCREKKRKAKTKRKVRA
jgi:hypothetical protein